MQIHHCDHGNQESLAVPLTKLNQVFASERMLCALSSPRLVKKADLSQQMTRENSKDVSFMDEEDSSSSGDSGDDSKMSDDDQFSIEKTYSTEDKDSSLGCLERTDDEVRRSYINRLVNMKLLHLKPKKKSQNICIFDWDDTLFCTSSFGNQPLTRIPQEFRLPLQNLDMAASRLLSKAVRTGDVFIITNSDEGWVEQSAKSCLPKTYQVITKKNIRVISARSTYGNLFPNDMYRWKEEAFLSIKRQFDEDVMTNLVVIGDCDIEIQAGNLLAQQFKHSLIKTVKFKGCPKLEELIKQHQIVINLFDEIFLGCKSMTVKLGKPSNH